MSSVLQPTDGARKFKENNIEREESGNGLKSTKIIDLSSIHNYESPIMFPDYEKSSVCQSEGLRKDGSKLLVALEDSVGDYQGQKAAKNGAKKGKIPRKSIDFESDLESEKSNLKSLILVEDDSSLQEDKDLGQESDDDSQLLTSKDKVRKHGALRINDDVSDFEKSNLNSHEAFKSKSQFQENNTYNENDVDDCSDDDYDGDHSHDDDDDYYKPIMLQRKQPNVILRRIDLEGEYEEACLKHLKTLENSSLLHENTIYDSSDDEGDPKMTKNKEQNKRMLRSIDFGPKTPSYNKSRLSFLQALTPFRPGEEHSVDLFESRLLDESLQLTAKERVLDLCEQERVLNVCEYLTKRLVDTMRKIGEGSYGEVFEATNSDGSKVAIKIVPVEGELEINGGKQASFTEILPEIAISKELSSLAEVDENGNQVSGFVSVYRTVCCQGAYPKKLLEEWDIWNEEHGSENYNPACFDDDQLFIMLEVEYAGQALEDFPVNTAAEAKSLVHQVSASLAVAERALKFEHRDLHWGNLLVLKSEEKICKFQLEGCPMTVPSSGIKIKLIDFTLSRLENDGCVVYCNLSDLQWLFDGQGDYQFDIYRKMREENGNSWEHFCPKTNVFWLHYLIEKLIKTKLKRRSKKLENFYKRILKYQSACELLQDEYFDY